MHPLQQEALPGRTTESDAAAGNGRGAPVRRHLSRSLGSGLILGGGITGVLLAVQHLSALPIFVTSWASSSALILSAPQSPAARPSTVVAAHLMCGGIGLVIDRLGFDRPVAVVVGVGLCIFLMLQLRIMHPPAAATPLIALTVAAAPGALLAGWIGGGLCLGALAMLLRTANDERNAPA